MSKITKYIEKELKKGFSKKKIKGALLKVKYPKEEIEKAFEEVEHHEFAQHKHFSPKFAVMLIGIIVVILIVGWIFYGLVAKETMELEKCRELKEINERYRCLKEIRLSQEKQLQSPCDKIDDDKEKDLCLMKFSRENDNINFCSQMIDTDFKATCISELWKINECKYKKIINEDYDECYTLKAIAEKDTTFCELTAAVGDCLADFAIEFDNIDFCENEINCMVKFINEKNNINICQDETGDIDNCLNEIQKFIEE